MLELNLAISKRPDTIGNYLYATLYFGGDTKLNKDKIKSLGYSWNDAIRYTWSKDVPLTCLEEEIAKAQAIDAVVVGEPCAEAQNGKTVPLYHNKDNFILAYRLMKSVEKEDIKSGVPENFTMPDILVGKKWNGSIYGDKGRYFVYLNGAKVSITDEKADEIKKFGIYEKLAKSYAIKAKQGEMMTEKILPYIMKLLNVDFCETNHEFYEEIMSESK